ncbi:hypothetical protein [Trichormus variabilis]|nr:hypothetical protein [Trichormus variabilis]
MEGNLTCILSIIKTLMVEPLPGADLPTFSKWRWKGGQLTAHPL